MKVKIKKLVPEAVIPKYANSTDAGLDLVATDVYFEEDGENLCYHTGLSIEIPEGHVGLIYPRSSISKYQLSLANSVGVIDSGYRGEIMIKMKLTIDYWSESKENDFDLRLKTGFFDFYGTAEDEYRGSQTLLERDIYKIGDRIAQLIIIPYPKIEFEEVEELSNSDRGDGGFGSTGQ